MNKNTYSMILRSEEKGRSVFETVIAAVFFVSVVFSIYSAANQPIPTIPDRKPAAVFVQAPELAVDHQG